MTPVFLFYPKMWSSNKNREKEQKKYFVISTE